MMRSMEETAWGRITRIREQRGWSRDELAREAKLTASYIYRIEKGDVKTPSYKTLQAIADALGVGVHELMEGREAPLDLFGNGWKERAMKESAPNTPPELSREVLALLDQLDASDREAVRLMLLWLAERKRGGVSGKATSAEYRIGRTSEDEYRAEGDK